MKLARFVPRPLVPTARRVYRKLRGRPAPAVGPKLGGAGGVPKPAAVPPQVLSRDELHAFWRSPDEVNEPEHYAATPAERSEFLVALLNRHCLPNDRVLEIGTNVGRNLEHLRLAGYGAVFGGLGMQQVEDIDESGIGGLVPGFRARVFSHAAAAPTPGD